MTDGDYPELAELQALADAVLASDPPLDDVRTWITGLDDIHRTEAP